MKTLVVHSKFIPSAPNGVIMASREMSDYEIAKLKDEVAEIHNNGRAMIIVRAGHLEFKSFNKDTGRYPRATFVALVDEDAHGYKIGMSVCSEKDQFVKKQGIKRATVRAEHNDQGTYFSDKGIDIAKQALVELYVLANEFIRNPQHYKNRIKKQFPQVDVE